MRKLLLVILVLAFLAGGCQTPARDFEQVSNQEKVILKFSHVVGDNTPKGRAARRWAQLVQERSRGRVEIQVFPNSTLYKDGEELAAVQKGYVQIIAPATSKLTEFSPVWQLLDLPFYYEDIDAVHRLLDGPVGEKLKQSLFARNLLVLAYWDNGFKVMAANRPLVKVSDFRDLNFRIMNSPMLAKQFRRLGANPVAMAFSDVYSALEKGQVEGSENPPSNLYSKKFYQLQKYITLSNHGYVGYAVVVNKSQWEALDQKIRQLLLDTLQEVTIWERQEAFKQNLEDLERIRRAQGTKIIELTPEQKKEWQRILAPLQEELAQEIGEDWF
ncbi:MAG: DctP family TRAP transporter solute-binding subunit [Bacillota bacterium]